MEGDFRRRFILVRYMNHIAFTRLQSLAEKVRRVYEEWLRRS